MDVAALDRLGEQRVDWRFKGFPTGFDGWTVAEVAAAKPRLTEFSTPLLVLDAAALEHNLATMARFCEEHRVDLAPHGKTTMAPQLFARQFAAGAWGITAATVAHVRAYRAFGVRTILMGNQLVDPDGLRWVAAELSADPDFRFLCFVDSVAGVAAMQDALTRAEADAPADANSPRPIEVVIDVGAPGGRTGVRTLAEGLTVAEAVHAADRLRLVGVGGFEGALAKDRSYDSLTIVRSFLTIVRGLAVRIDERGLFDQTEEIVLTAGGSAYFDDVVDILTTPWPSTRPIRTVLRSGAYITHDDGHYRRLTPLTTAGSGPGPFQAALRILGRVLSLPEPGLALLDFGKRDAPMDLGLPEPQEIRHVDGWHSSAEGLTITALADQHAFLSYGHDTRLSIGDVVACGISHPCTAFDKWQLIPVVDDGHVVDVIRTFF